MRFRNSVRAADGASPGNSSPTGEGVPKRSLLANRWLLAALFSVLTAGVANSAEPLTGYFIAQERCEAFQSKNRQTNPGDVFTEVDRAYPIFAINKAAGDYFQIKVAGAPVVDSRWVHVSCGVHVVEAGTVTAGGNGDGSGDTPLPPAGPESENNLLALSWQPAFCETRPNKTECQSLNNGDLPVTETQLSLHGLWPQPRSNVYCGVSSAHKALDEARRWSELPAPDLDAETREALSVVMPGTMSHLDRHEWIKHGTCFRGAGGADEYYDDTLLIVAAINDSAIGRFLADHVGAEVETPEIRDLFDQEFGAGAGARVQFHCTGDQGRTLLQEIKISLQGRIEPTTNVGDLLQAADTMTIGCPRGIIDPAGLQ